MSLALDIGLGRFPLRVEGIEVLFEARVGGDAGVDGAANGGGHVASPARRVRSARETRLRVAGPLFSLGASPFGAAVEGEEAVSVPSHAGDGARDAGEAGLDPSLPFKAVGDHRDAMQEAGMVTKQYGSNSDRLARRLRWGRSLFRSHFLEPDRLLGPIILPARAAARMARERGLMSPPSATCSRQARMRSIST